MLRTRLRLISIALAGAACLPAQATAASPLVSTEPSLRPGFSQRVSDYAVRCPDRSLRVTVRHVRGTSVTVGGQRYGQPRTIPIKPGQAVTIGVRRGDRLTRHFVRCLPDDFPAWRYRHIGAQTPRWYLVTPNKATSGQFVAMFDHRGVPVWWYRSPEGKIANDASLIDGNFAYAAADLLLRGFETAASAAYRIVRPDGRLVRTVKAVGSATDFHELKRLGDDYLLLTYRPRDHVDLRAYGGPADATVLDSVVQRIDRRGRLVWSWSSRDHIGLAETGRWWRQVLAERKGLPDGREAYDPTHINSFELAGRDLIISLRHTDAVYRIRMRDGRVLWKLGGTRTPRSLHVVGDPANYPLGGQHDARLWRGTVTVHDNGTGLNRPPRAVRYAIDTKRRRAILLESLVEPLVTSSLCCGSARKLGNGDWLVGWGGQNVSSLLTRRGRLVNRLTIGDRFDPRLPIPSKFFSYRTVPVPARAISAARLRAGMDAMSAAGAAD